MALKIPDVGELALLTMLKNTFNASTVKLKLYKNNYTPVDASVVGDFTEANFNGYTAGGVSVTTFSVPATVAGKASTTANPAAWTKSAGGTGNDIYGYYVTDAAGTTLLWAERAAAAPISMNNTGEGITVTLVQTYSSEF